jgi:hypothetical protein
VDPEDDTLYSHVKAENAEAIVSSLGGTPVPELQCDLNEHFDKQVRVVLENAGTSIRKRSTITSPATATRR